MARSYTHLTAEERYYIRKRLKAGDSLSEIARLIGRSPSTVSRELKRNTGLRGYRPKQAQRLADGRLTESVRSHVIGKLKLDWSPEHIAGRMRLEGGDWVSHETIYRMVWRDRREGGDLHTCLRHSPRKRRKRYGKNDFRGRIPGRVGISERPPIVDARARFGDWEGDTVIGKGHRGGLVTLAERKSKALLAGRIARRTKAETADALRRVTTGLEGLFDTITYDNGREFSDHALVSEATGSDAYFARPYHSWERGLQRALKRASEKYFPKSMPLDQITDEQVRRAVHRINNRPRKCLAFKTPIEVLQSAYDSGEITVSPSVALEG